MLCFKRTLYLRYITAVFKAHCWLHSKSRACLDHLAKGSMIMTSATGDCDQWSWSPATPSDLIDARRARMLPPADIHLLVTRWPNTHRVSSPCNMTWSLTTGCRPSVISIVPVCTVADRRNVIAITHVFDCTRSPSTSRDLLVIKCWLRQAISKRHFSRLTGSTQTWK